MKTRHVLYLLITTIYFLILSAVAFKISVIIAPNKLDRLLERDANEWTRKVQSGEMHPTQQQVVEMVQGLRRNEALWRELNLTIMRKFGIFMIVGAALNTVLTFFVRALEAKSNQPDESKAAVV